MILTKLLCKYCKYNCFDTKTIDALQSVQVLNNHTSARLTCPSGTYSDAGSYVCTDCPAGSKCPAANESPVPCPPGTYSDVNETECHECSAGNQCLNPAGGLLVSVTIDYSALDTNNAYCFCVYYTWHSGIKLLCF